MKETKTSEPYVRVVDGFCDTLPDIPIFIIRDEAYARDKFRKGYRKFRVTVHIEEIE